MQLEHWRDSSTFNASASDDAAPTPYTHSEAQSVLRQDPPVPVQTSVVTVLPRTGNRRLRLTDGLQLCTTMEDIRSLMEDVENVKIDLLNLDEEPTASAAQSSAV